MNNKIKKNMTDYNKLFQENPIKPSEPMEIYYKRIAKKAKKSYRTIGDQYNRWIKSDEKVYSEPFLKSIKSIDEALIPLTKKEEKRIWKNIEKKLPKRNLHIIINDSHIPFENKTLLEKISLMMEDNKHQIAGFHIAGDYLDMLGFCTQNKDNVLPKGYTVGMEYEIGNTWLDIFEMSLLPDTVKSYLSGNHEVARVEKFLKNVNNAAYRDILIDPVQGLKLKERGFNIYKNWKEDSIRLGNLEIIHGIYLNQNAIKSHLNKLNNSVIYGHSHKLGAVYEANKQGFNNGCLCDINSEGFKYVSRLERADWKNGFAVVYLEDNGSFKVNLIDCSNNEFYFGNRKY